MLIESIRELNQAVPFRPYEIRMASGHRHQVSHPDFVFISPRGSYVIVVNEQNERPHHLSALLIEDAVVRGRTVRRARKRAA